MESSPAAETGAVVCEATKVLSGVGPVAANTCTVADWGGVAPGAWGIVVVVVVALKPRRDTG